MCLRPPEAENRGAENPARRSPGSLSPTSSLPGHTPTRFCAPRSTAEAKSRPEGAGPAGNVGGRGGGANGQARCPRGVKRRLSLPHFQVRAGADEPRTPRLSCSKKAFVAN